MLTCDLCSITAAAQGEHTRCVTSLMDMFRNGLSQDKWIIKRGETVITHPSLMHTHTHTQFKSGKWVSGAQDVRVKMGPPVWKPTTDINLYRSAAKITTSLSDTRKSKWRTIPLIETKLVCLKHVREAQTLCVICSKMRENALSLHKSFLWLVSFFLLSQDKCIFHVSLSFLQIRQKVPYFG